VRVLAVPTLLALANCSTLSADFQRILHTSRVAVFIAASRENCARRDAEGMRSSCPARGSGDHEGAPKRLRATFTFLFFLGSTGRTAAKCHKTMHASTA